MTPMKTSFYYTTLNLKHMFCAFSQLNGAIDDCSCTVDTVDYFNNVKVYPRLQSLLVRDYFRFYRVTLKGVCPFWADDSKCAIRFCHVKPCLEVNFFDVICNLILALSNCSCEK